MAIHEPVFSLARDCGHWTRLSRRSCSGIEWCETCREYRGVIVTRLAPPTAHEREAVTPLGETGS